jgi:predicted MFS family arabinose efflux permease
LVIQEPDRRPARLDVAGALLATGGMTSLVYGFIRAASDGWGDRVTLGAFAGAALLLLLFLAVEVRIAQPIVPLRLLAHRNRASAYLTMLLLPATMFSAFFFLTQFIQDVLGFSPLQAGLAFLPLTLVMFATVQVVPRVLPRVGPKPILVFGATLVAGADAWLTQLSAASAYVSSLVGPMILLGIGIGCSFLPLQTLILSGVARHESGAAAGLLQTMQQVGGSLGLAILVTVFGRASRDAAAHPLAAASRQMHVHHVFAHGVASAFSVGTCFAACTLLVALVAIGADSSGQPGTTEQTAGGSSSGERLPGHRPTTAA